MCASNYGSLTPNGLLLAILLINRFDRGYLGKGAWGGDWGMGFGAMVGGMSNGVDWVGVKVCYLLLIIYILK